MRGINVLLKKVMVFMVVAAFAFSFASTIQALVESQFTTLAELQAAARELNAEVTADSVTLLKNIANSLPLAEGDKVTIFGVFSDQSGTSSNSGFAFGGQGSGQGSDPLGYVSLHTGLEEAGLVVNQAVKDYYASSSHGGISFSRAATVSNSATDVSLRGLATGWTPRNNSYSVGEEDPDGADGVSNLETVKSSFEDFNDAAVVVIRRTGTEGGDYSLFNTPGHSNPLDHYYQPDDNELALIDYVAQYFDNVIVLINSANAMELTDIEDNENVDSILWIGYPGGSGNLGVGKVMAGLVSPSGRTPDLYGVDYKTDPVWQNFAGNIQTHLRVVEREMIEQIGTNNWVRHTISVAVTQEDPWSFDSQGNVTLKDPLALIDIVPTDGTTGTMSYRGRPVVERFSRITDMNGVLDMPQAVTYSSNSAMSNLLDYEEGIYVGYRFYETANNAGYFDGIGEVNGGKFARVEAGYNNRTDGVLYPFGYGLSYTTFTQEFVNASAFEGQTLNTAFRASMEVQVKVTNTGNVAGKEAVQLYLTAPYTAGGIEKSYVSMIAFGKTGVIKPGESEIVTLSFNVQDLASFDWNDANHDNHKGYELDPGTYTFRLQNNSHDEIANFNMTLAEIKHFDIDAVTEASILPLFSPDNGEWDGTRNDPDYYSTVRNEFVTPNSTMTLMSRADFNGTFPASPTAEDLKFSDAALQIINAQAAYTSFNDLTSDPWYVSQSEIPADWTQASAEDVANRVAGKTAIQLIDMFGVAYDDASWSTFINQLTWAEMQSLINNSAQNAVDSIGRPKSANADGPGAFPNSQNGGSGGGVGTHWCAAANLASTFDVEYAEAIGRMEGEHSLWNGAQGWYGPGLQMHRSPAAGRDFEYYSQDPLLTGLMGANQVKGATSTGVIVYMKHLFLNEQETSRYTLHTFADEQTSREIYLRAFEWSIKMGGESTSTMSSYPSTGLVHPTANYNLYEKLLHDEWGLNSFSITDYFNNDNTLTTADMSARCNQVPLNSWQTNFGRNMDGVWDEVKNVLVVTMPTPTTYDPQNVNGGASRAYKDAITGAPASVMYASDEAALAAGFVPVLPGDSIDAYTQWAAYRNLIHRILYTTVNSNVMKNGLVVSPWSVTTTGATYTPIGLNSSITVAGDQVPEGLNVSYTLKSGTLPTGLTLNANGTITGIATTEGVYTITVGAYLTDTNWVGMGGGNNTYQRTFTISVEQFLLYTGNNALVAGQAFTGTFTVNPHFLPLSTLTVYNNTYWGAAFSATSSTSTNLNHSTSALPAGITLQAPTVASGFSDPLSPNYGVFTITGTPTTPVASKIVYMYFGTGSSTNSTNVRTRYFTLTLNFTVAGVYVLDMNYTDSVDQTTNFIPGKTMTIPNPSREGYVFAGWFTDELCTIKASKIAGVAPTTTLYAKWIDLADSAAALAELSSQIADLLNNQYSDAAELATQVSALQTQINAVLTRLTTAETFTAQVPAIQASITLITESLVALTGDVDEEFAALTILLDEKFAEIDSRFAAAELALAAAQSALEDAINAGDAISASALESAIESLEAAIELGNSDLATLLASNVDALTTLINATNDRIDDAEARAAEAEARLDETEARLDAAEAALLDASANAADAEARLDLAEADLLEAALRLDDAEAALLDAETGLADALARLADAEAGLTDALARLDDAEASIQALIDATAILPDTGCATSLSVQSTLFYTFSVLAGLAALYFFRKKQ